MHEIHARIHAALAFLNTPSLIDNYNYLSYLDISIEGLVHAEKFKGIVPCRSIWDIEGGRLAAVLLFDVVG